MATSEKHEERLREVIKELREEGYNVIDLEMKSPDAIAVKDNKIIAVEVLGRTFIKGRGWKNNFTIKRKKQIYDMFDDIIIKTFDYNNPPEEE